MTDVYGDVRAFHRRFGHLCPDHTSMPSAEALQFRRELLHEEVRELTSKLAALQIQVGGGSLTDESTMGLLCDVAQEAADLVYVAVGTCVALGLDFDATWREVQRANMEKGVVCRCGHDESHHLEVLSSAPPVLRLRHGQCMFVGCECDGLVPAPSSKPVKPVDWEPPEKTVAIKFPGGRA